MSEVLEQQQCLSGLTQDELVAWAKTLDLPGFRARQIFRQIHMRLVDDFQAMSDIPASLRDTLTASLVPIRSLELDQVQVAEDGTRKLLLRTRDGNFIESVLIPMDKGAYTQCISSQVGCAMGCAFCMTGRMGLIRNLDSAEIVDQVRLALGLAEMPVRNLVFMGMGEPLHNFDNVRRSVEVLGDDLGQKFSARKVTISTCGLIPGMKRVAAKEINAKLAVSLNAVDDETRSALMPINRTYPLAELINVLKTHKLPQRERYTIEYILMKDLNDSEAHARKLVKLLTGVKCLVNLIVYNEVPELPYRRPDMDTVTKFQATLKSKGIIAPVRHSAGADIMAACGQLATSRKCDPNEQPSS